MQVTKSRETQVAAIIVAIRACFARLRSVADALHGDLGITATMRAVMEAVFAADGMTVPAIAREKRVSRQNIQVVVDSLVAAGLVRLAVNPAHKRSPLVVLTGQGRAAFVEMNRRERSLLAAIAADLTPAAARATLQTLAAMQRRLDTMESQSTKIEGEDDETD